MKRLLLDTEALIWWDANDPQLRESIVSATSNLEEQEAELRRLLGAESIDRNALFAQLDVVIRARGEVERASSLMTIEMREALTAGQWNQLQSTDTIAQPRGGGRGFRGGRGGPQ